MDGPRHSRCDTVKVPHCSMTTRVQYRLKAALHRQWWRLYVSDKFSTGKENSKQRNKHKDRRVNLSESSLTRHKTTENQA